MLHEEATKKSKEKDPGMALPQGVTLGPSRECNGTILLTAASNLWAQVIVTFASQGARMTGMCHHTRLILISEKMRMRAVYRMREGNSDEDEGGPWVQMSDYSRAFESSFCLPGCSRRQNPENRDWKDLDRHTGPAPAPPSAGSKVQVLSASPPPLLHPGPAHTSPRPRSPPRWLHPGLVSVLHVQIRADQEADPVE
ncbi:uncharacterized protein isoform X3 [Macaca fascicularis]|uniref:uncharacterized protein isoform X3 n=1 Tax=Macaca fascicularis TaxID=9541 RepID=UPI003D15A71D